MSEPIPLPTTANIADDHLEPIRAWVHANHGSMTRLTEKMKTLTSSKITRQAISRWMNRDPESRQEPKLGIGILLERAYQQLIVEDNAGRSA